jgi:hypothetical protein
MGDWASMLSSRALRVHCDSEAFVAATSYLTDRSVFINRHPTRFLLSPLWLPSSTPQLVERVASSFAQYGRVRLQVRQLALAVGEAGQPEDFATSLDKLLATIGDGKTRRESSAWGPDRGFVKRLLVALWCDESIGWPAAARPFPKAKLYEDIIKIGGSHHCLSLILNAHSQQFTPASYRFPLAHHALKRIGLRSVGDFTPTTCGDMNEDFPSGTAPTMAKTIYSLQVGEYGIAAMQHHPEDLAPPAVRSKIYKSYDVSFSWVHEQKNLTEWRLLAEEWVRSLRHSKVISITVLNQFFRHASLTPVFPPDPLDYLRINPSIASELRWKPASPVYVNKFREFLDWILETRCSVADDDDLPVRLPGFRNPHPPAKHARNRPETHRDAMPTLFVRLAIEILTENDWAWSRSTGDQLSRGGDTLLAEDASGSLVKTWAPLEPWLSGSS